MGERHIRFPAVLAATLLLGGPVQARVKLYQVARLIMFKSDCQIDKLDEKTAAGRVLRFFATCENVSFYPDGLDVICIDADDDRSCKIGTPAKTFDNLRMLDRR